MPRTLSTRNREAAESDIERAVAAMYEGKRGDYLWNTQKASQAVGCHPHKFGDWLYRTRRKLIALYIAMPGETAAELAVLIAKAEAERQRRYPGR